MNPTFAHGNIVYILLECDPVPWKQAEFSADEFLLRFLYALLRKRQQLKW